MEESVPVTNKPIHAKVVLAGASGVGKTSISNRAFEGAFSEDTKPTVGSGFMKGTINTPRGKVTLEVWDTAGQEHFSSLVPIFFNRASVVILVYDITDMTSFNRIDHYVTMVNDKANDDCIIVLAGNKKDLVNSNPSSRQVTTQEAQNLADTIGAKYLFEVSALSGENINKIFRSVANDPDLATVSSQEDKIITPQENPHVEQKKGGCC
ncbi:Ras- protein Rab-31 [Tritrichomonas musculus]|uniref:Ras- protein Rab-31 n=1 Tax=Tritrichomonas musculus TaxID=1915356 RepID=A0ABR2KY51_9EUKA